MGFLNIFGGSAVSPASVAFAEYSFATSTTLYWPSFSAGQTDIAARFMNITATVNTSLNVTMPDATLVSTGYDVIIFNKGAYTFDVVDSQGGAIATIATGQTYYLLLNDNTTQAGTWQTVQFGVGTGSASAAALAGAGLIAAAGLLNANLNTTTVSNSYSITTADRAVLQVWTGGAGTITLPTAASVGDGFFFALANNGSGNITVTASGGDDIDGASTSVFSQTNSGFIVSSGTAWYTVGKGLQNTFAVTLLNLNCAGNSDITETSAQAENIIQQYTGVLTGNINVIVPNTVQLYYIFNNTTGSYTLTVKTAAGTGIAVAQGTHAILYCDGTNVLNGFTAIVTSTVALSPGSANSPNLNFVGSGSTGIYSPTTNQFAITAGGFEVMNFISAASSVNYLQTSASATGVATSISALGSDTDIGITLTPKGAGTVNIAKASLTGGTIDGIIIGGSSAAAITGTTITASSSFVGNLTGNVTGNCSGTSGSTTGNAATATALATARAINGVNFDGTAPITVTAAAGTLSGATLASNVLASSLTSVGTLATLTVTATITGSISGNAATVTTNANLTGDITSSGNATTLATVNSNVGSFTNASITVNAKGLITAASSGGSVSTAAGNLYTGSQTWTSPNNTTAATVFKCTLVGPGGGGAGCAAATAGGSGGGGATCILYVSGLAASTGYVYTEGAAGTAGASGANNGVDGGTSTFVVGGITMTAVGGKKGIAAGAGGAASNGTVNIQGGGAAGGIGGNYGHASGPGGSSTMGGGGNAIIGAAGVAGGNYGGGGSGGNGQNGTGPFAGAAGAAGCLLIERLSG